MKVEIYDQVYNVAGDLEPSYVEQLAKYVDLRMRQVARGTGAVDSVKVAVLAALSIADELHNLRQNREKDETALRANAERCLKLIDRALQQTA
jgi:cell division protein ZapA